MARGHVDAPVVITGTDAPIFAYIQDTKKIARHQFYPFIEFTKVTPRFKKQRDGKRKIENKERPLAYASHLDALIYSWYSALLSAEYEEYIKTEPFASSVIAYRKLRNEVGFGKSNIHFANEVFNSIKRLGRCVVLTFDVESFFPTLRHDHLKAMWCRVLNKSFLPEDQYTVFRSLTKFAFIKREDLLTHFGEGKKDRRRLVGKRRSRICSSAEFHEFKKMKFVDGRPAVALNPESIRGIPQGSSMSGLLSNIYMLSFDSLMYSEVTRLGGMYCRYSDDIAIVLPEGIDEEVTRVRVWEECKKIGLVIHPDKSETIFLIKRPRGCSLQVVRLIIWAFLLMVKRYFFVQKQFRNSIDL